MTPSNPTLIPEKRPQTDKQLVAAMKLQKMEKLLKMMAQLRDLKKLKQVLAQRRLCGSQACPVAHPFP